jgi:hypothetical protein
MSIFLQQILVVSRCFLNSTQYIHLIWQVISFEKEVFSNKDTDAEAEAFSHYRAVQ